MYFCHFHAAFVNNHSKPDPESILQARYDAAHAYGCPPPPDAMSVLKRQHNSAGTLKGILQAMSLMSPSSSSEVFLAAQQ